MDEKLAFAQTLDEIRKTAIRQGGFIDSQQISEAFDSFKLDDEQLKMVHHYLKSRKIGIDQPYSVCSQPQKDSKRDAVTLAAIDGDTEARNHLVELYLQEVTHIARLYDGQGVAMDDLVGEGNVALAEGVNLLSRLQGSSFTNEEKLLEAQGMLGKMIMDAMEEHIGWNANIHKADCEVVDKVNMVMEKAKELSEDLCRKVTPKELAAETGLSIEDIHEAVCMSGFQIEYIEGMKDGEAGF